MAGALIFSTVYGYQVEANNDSYVAAAEEYLERSSATVTAGWLVDFIPIREYIRLPSLFQLTDNVLLSSSEISSLDYLAPNGSSAESET